MCIQMDNQNCTCVSDEETESDQLMTAGCKNNRNSRVEKCKT